MQNFVKAVKAGYFENDVLGIWNFYENLALSPLYCCNYIPTYIECSKEPTSRSLSEKNAPFLSKNMRSFVKCCKKDFLRELSWFEVK